jgi:hypothetical protein
MKPSFDWLRPIGVNPPKRNSPDSNLSPKLIERKEFHFHPTESPQNGHR